MTMVKRIAVIGAGTEDDRLNGLAERVGRLVAERGAVLVCGGLGGVMAAACRGAVAAGGVTVGILPGRDVRESPPNPWVSVPVLTGLGQARNQLVVLTGDAVIAVGGGWGTLSEIALARKQGRPVVLIESWDLPAAGAPGEDLLVVQEPEQAVEAAVSLAGE